MSGANAAEPRVLVVDDDPIVADSLAEFIRGEGGAAATAQDGGEALAVLRDARPPFQLVLADMNMPRMDGMALLKQVRRRHPDVAVVVITGYGTIESAVEAVQQGAFDYLTKPIVDEEIRETIARALEQRVLRGTSTPESDDRPAGRLNGQVIGRDYRMQKVFDLVEAVADSRTTVLITGESGTGKSMVARAIHQQSSRAEKPFVTMACGSIPETLLESELFGHVKGAFTGADRDKQGKLLAAHEGTLFLDEINSATPALQLKLLRVLQEKQFEPVGSSETVSVDVRFVLASNASLEALVREGQFREDLYYRINVVNLELPPLRQRESDIPLLVEHFLEKYSRETGRTVTGVDEEVMRLLRRYTWPGNVRELENAIERAVVLSSAPVIDAEVLPEKVRHQQPDGQPGFREKRRNPQGLLPDRWTPQPLREALKEPEKRIILAALQANDWNRQKTAEVLDINRTTLYKKIKQYDLETLAAEG
jgi:DNA-binding NtrC family response regulator